MTAPTAQALAQPPRRRVRVEGPGLRIDIDKIREPAPPITAACAEATKVQAGITHNDPGGGCWTASAMARPRVAFVTVQPFFSQAVVFSKPILKRECKRAEIAVSRDASMDSK